MFTLESESNKMLSLKSKLKFKNLWVIKFNHYISFICDNTLLATFEESLFLHKFERVKFAIWKIAREKDSRKSSSSNASNNLEVG